MKTYTLDSRIVDGCHLIKMVQREDGKGSWVRKFDADQEIEKLQQELDFYKQKVQELEKK